MNSQANISKNQLQQALDASGCRLDLDVALADPTLSRCLHITAKAMKDGKITHTNNEQTPRRTAWALRLLTLAGNTDWPRIRAGDID